MQHIAEGRRRCECGCVARVLCAVESPISISKTPKAASCQAAAVVRARRLRLNAAIVGDSVGRDGVRVGVRVRVGAGGEDGDLGSARADRSIKLGILGGTRPGAWTSCRLVPSLGLS